MDQQNQKLSEVIKQVVSEKGVDKDELISILETAISTAAKRIFGQERVIEAQYNPELDEIELFQILQIVDEVENKYHDITPLDVEEYQEALVEHPGDPLPEVGDEILVQIFYRDEDKQQAEKQDKKFSDLIMLESAKVDFGRIAAQTAKQVILQRMREAEQNIVYNRYKDRQDQIMTGRVRRFDKGNVIVEIDSDNAEAMLPQREQVPRESYRPGDTICAYVKKVQRSSKDPQIILSRTDPNFVVRLFEQQVPEMNEGTVQILRVARHPGTRTKIAVYSSASDIDAVGACVGLRGQRVQAVVTELHGEKIDIVPFHNDPARFVCSAISPAEVSRVFIEEEATAMELIVPNDQLSLAIGRGGQNVRLAAQLTGWNLDIISEARLDEIKKEAKRLLLEKSDFPEGLIDTLFALGYNKLEHIAKVDPMELSQLPGFGMENAEKIVSEAQRILRLSHQEEEDRMHEEQNLSDIATYLGLSSRDAKKIYAGGYRNLVKLFVEGNAKRLDARTGIGVNLAASVIKNLEELALGQEVYTEESLAQARNVFEAAMNEADSVPVEEAYEKVVSACGERIFPLDEDDDDLDEISGGSDD
ncbi:MAG: transcription termination/antitermination protein NusA [Proteobacteria bacterium]|nr:transcription termination/antitermination protein NusA [Pseudomonadota bacterium]